MNSISVRNLCFDYNSATCNSIIQRANLNVRKGQIYGLLGPSGCGKTTLLKVILGLLKPKSGEVSVFGFKPGSRESGTPGEGVGYMPQEISLPTLFTVNEAFKYFGAIYSCDEKFIETQMNYLLDLLKLNMKNELIANLSGGQKRRVSFAIAVFTLPRLLILDEPTVGVDPIVRQLVWSFLSNLLKQQNTTIIVTTHYIEEMKFAQKVAFMRNGRILKEGDPGKLIKRYECRGLEDVFYHLCVKNEKLKKATADENDRSSSQQSDENFVARITAKDPLRREVTSNISNNVAVIKSVIWKTWITSVRFSKIGVSFPFILPVVVMLFCSVCIGTAPTDVNIGLVVNGFKTENTSVNLNDTEYEIIYLPDLLLKNINKKMFKPIIFSSVDIALKEAKRRNVIGFIHLKQNFSSSFFERDFSLFDQSEFTSDDTIDAGSIHLFVDASDKIMFTLVQRQLNEDIQKFREDAYEAIGVNRSLSKLPVQIEDIIHASTSEQMTQITRELLIKMTSLSSFAMAITFSAIPLHIDLHSELYTRLFSCGVKIHQIIIGEILIRCLVYAFASIFHLFCIVYLFNVHCNGPLTLAAFSFFLNSVCGITLGIFFAVAVKSVFNCHIMTTAYSIAIITIGGTYWPLEALPYFMQDIVRLIPGPLLIQATDHIFNYENIDFMRKLFAPLVSFVFFTFSASFGSYFYFNV